MAWKHRLSDIDPEARTGVCAACGPTGLSGRTRDGRMTWQCLTARREQRGHTPEKRRRERLMRRYGLTPEAWGALLLAQSGRCGICLEPLVDPHIDHDHDTGAVRGLLCRHCNLGLGHLGDDIEGIERALTYLQRGFRHS